MRILLALIAVLVLAALGLWFFVGGESASPIAVGDAHELSNPAHATEASPLDKQAGDAASKSSARSTGVVPRTESKAAAPSAHLAEIRGRVLLPGGAPAAEVAIELLGRPADQERLIQNGLPDHWDDLNAATGADGRFSIRFDPPLAYQFALNVHSNGFATASWRWNEIAADEIKDIGDVELVRGGSIAGRIVDTKGNTLKNGWSVFAETAIVGHEGERSAGRDRTRGRADVDPNSGEFRIEDMPPGSTHVGAHSDLVGRIEGPSVEVRAGEVVEATIRYEGPDVGSRITLTIHSEPFHVYALDVRDIVLRGASIEPRRAEHEPQGSQFHFDDLPAGRYTLEISDPKFLPWSKDGVAPGTVVDAKLKGSASIRLEVVDAKKNQKLVPSRILVRFDKANFSPNEFQIHSRGADLPKNGVFDGLIPVDQTLIVSADGYADCEVPVPDLNPNEVRKLRAAMASGTRIGGRVVVGEARTPAASVEVVLEDSSNAFDQRRLDLSRAESELQSTRSVTDASGHFLFALVSPGKHRLRASYSPLLATETEVDATDGADKLDLVLTLPPCSSLVGRIIAPEGASFEGLSLFAAPAQAASKVTMNDLATKQVAREKTAVGIASDGSFRTGPLALGEMQVALRLARATIPLGFHAAKDTDDVSIDLGRVTLTAGAETHHDFDARAIFPGRIAIRLRVNGAQSPGAVIEARDAEKPWQIDGAAFVDSNATCTTNPLACKSYRLIARDTEYAWFFVAPDIVTVKPGETASTSIDVTLAEGVLQMLDDNKMPARVVKPVAIRREGENVDSPLAQVSLATNSDGRLQLRLPPGSYRLYSAERPINRDASSASFDMTPTGPQPEAVEFPR